MTNSLSEQKPDRCSKLTALGTGVLCLFYVSSLATLSTVQETGWNILFVLGRYASYLLMAAWVFADVTKLDGFGGSLNNILCFLKEHLVFDGFLILSLMACYFARVIEPLVLLLFFLFVRNYPAQKLLRLFFWCSLATLGANVLACLIGILPNLAFLRDGQIRYALGFIYPLECSSLAFFCTLSLLAGWQKQYGWKADLAALALVVLVYFFTRARFSLVLFVFVLIVMVLLDLWHKRDSSQPGDLIASKGWRIFTFVLLLILFTAPVIGALLYDEDVRFWRVLNGLSNNRLVLGWNAFHLMDPGPFGKLVTWIGFGSVDTVEMDFSSVKGYNYVDISYIKNLFDYGYVYMVMVFGMYVWALWHYGAKREWRIVMVLLGALFMSLFEARLLQIAINIALPFCSGFVSLPSSKLAASCRPEVQSSIRSPQV